MALFATSACTVDVYLDEFLKYNEPNYGNNAHKFQIPYVIVLSLVTTQDIGLPQRWKITSK